MNVDEISNAVYDRFDKLHLWIGFTRKSEDSYEKYFEQDDLAEGKYCQFCQDIGLDEEYDEDFIGILPLLEESVILDEIIEEIPIHEDDVPLLKKRCAELNINKINAIFWYSDPDLRFNHDKKFNGIKYIGMFKAE